ncbi:MAG: 16S rRNA (cytidine(1402)-2'-O)-methyltransferase [Chloroflexi bacterium]|nr:16S rRNA (cytidine(1402)-2'-O)-methyltransferase [Chloroflexota bacterium]
MVVGTLYVVATPIGNLEDVTLRALRVLREVPVVAAEDTRVTRTLFRAHEIHTPLVAFHEFSSGARRNRLLDRLAEGDMALVTDAGMPGVSDPGFPLVRDALAAGHEVVALPGPSAVLAALVVSGLPMHAFSFHGFLPRTTAQRQTFLRAHADDPETLVVFESPHRIVKSVEDLVAVLGPDRPFAVARELTKKFEEVLRGRAGEVLDRLKAREPRGEFTLVVGSRSAPMPPGAVAA